MKDDSHASERGIFVDRDGSSLAIKILPAPAAASCRQARG